MTKFKCDGFFIWKWPINIFALKIKARNHGEINASVNYQIKANRNVYYRPQHKPNSYSLFTTTQDNKSIIKIKSVKRIIIMQENSFPIDSSLSESWIECRVLGTFRQNEMFGQDKLRLRGFELENEEERNKTVSQFENKMNVQLK